jgi:hypothetical protein
VALSAVLTVVHGSHEDTSTALKFVSADPTQTDQKKTYSLGRTLPTQALDLAIAINLVVLEDGELGLSALVLDLLRGGVDLLLALLGATTKAQDKVQRRLLLDVVVRQRAAVLELLAGEDQTLLVGRDTLLVWGVLASAALLWGESEALRTLDLGLDIVNGVPGLHLEGDGLAREGLDEDLHPEGLRARWLARWRPLSRAEGEGLLTSTRLVFLNLRCKRRSRGGRGPDLISLCGHVWWVACLG